MKLVQFDFPYKGSYGKEMAQEMEGLARSIAQEPGFVWKIWTENEKMQEAGGIYIFQDDDSALAFIKKHLKRLKEFGVDQVNVKMFDVNIELTRITKGPLS